MADFNLRIAGIENQSIVDGPGFRYTVFFQGCGHNCKGCHNPQTFDYNGGSEMTVNAIIEEIKKSYWIDGVTVSGGEPFDQKQGLEVLVKAIKQLGHHIICFSGYTFENLVKDENNQEILANIDVLIDGEFKIEQKTLTQRFRGSKNQRVIDVKESLKEHKIIEIDW